MEKMKVTMKMIGEFKDMMNVMDEVDMPIPNTDNAIDVANYFVFQFSDDDAIMEQFFNITNNENIYNDGMNLEDIVAIAESFFIALPKSFLELTVIYFQGKHMQFQKGMNDQMQMMSQQILGQIQTLTGESIEPSVKVESTPTD